MSNPMSSTQWFSGRSINIINEEGLPCTHPTPVLAARTNGNTLPSVQPSVRPVESLIVQIGWIEHHICLRTTHEAGLPLTE